SLTGTNSYTGTTTIAGGTLQVLPTIFYSAVLPTASAITLTGGTLDLGGYPNNTVASVSLQSGNIIATSTSHTGFTGTLTSTSDYDMQSGSVSAILAGTVNL